MNNKELSLTLQDCRRRENPEWANYYDYSGERVKIMKNFTEHDQRQFELMLKNLCAFEDKQIELHSLIGSLEFLFNAMESVDEEWEEKFLHEITVLESINAIKMIKLANEEAPEVSDEKAQVLIKTAVSNLKLLIEKSI